MFHAKLLTAAKILPKPIQTSWIGDEADICDEISGPALWCKYDPRMEGNSDTGYIFSTTPFQGPFIDVDPEVDGEADDDPWDIWWVAQPGHEHWYSIIDENRGQLDVGIIDAVKHFGFKYRIKDEHLYIYKNIDTKDPDKVVDLSDEELLLRSQNKRKKR